VATLGGSSDETIVAGVLVDTSRPISCVTYGGRTGENLRVEGSWIQGNAKVETSGASNTVTGVDSAEDAFLLVDVGDELFIVNHDAPMNSQDRNLRRVVVTNANDDTVTVNDPDLDLDDTSTGYNYFWRDRVCSSSDYEGWVPVSGAEQVSALVNVERYDVDSEDGITVALQCKLDGADAIIEDITSTGVTAVGVYPFNTTASYDFCRITLLLDSFDSSSDTGAEIENLDGVMSVRYANP
jgi:hypothetical protein